MRHLIQPRFDLGVRSLLPSWKALFTGKYFREDFIGGLTVAFVALPISLAIALASGVEPGVGLITAIVTGIVAALFGGAPLAVTGPAAAMAVLNATVIQEHGLGGILVVALACGVLQTLTGALGLGKFVRLIPVSVVEGFTAGIGAIIFIGQLPRALGLPPPDQNHVFDVVSHVTQLLHKTQSASLGVCLLTLAFIWGVPRVSPRAPAVLIAVVIATIASGALGVSVPTIGHIPDHLPMPTLPAMPDTDGLMKLAPACLAVYAVASMESLLSTSAVDKMVRGERHDPDQELIGQGLGNAAAAIFGGIPATCVIARSSVNVQSGSKTRRAAIIHSLVLIVVVMLMSQTVAKIPLPALAAVLLSAAIRMVDPRKFRTLWNHARTDAVIYGITFVTIVVVDLLEGVQWGIVAALALAAVRLGQSRIKHDKPEDGDIMRLELSGPVTFMASMQIDRLRKTAAELPPNTPVLLDLRGVTSLDASGAEMLIELVESCLDGELRIAVYGLSEKLTEQLIQVDSHEIVKGHIARTERDVLKIAPHGAHGTPRRRLELGVRRFRDLHRPRYRDLFESLESGQAPHTLFIACSDSRVDPTLITSTDPGELFIVRNVGNMVPKFERNEGSAIASAIDFAVGVAKVEQIVICAHSGCGAIAAIRSPDAIPKALEALHHWLHASEIDDMVHGLPTEVDNNDVARLSVLRQVEHVRQYPVVKEAMAEGRLSVLAWYFDIPEGEIEEWSPIDRKWHPVGAAGPISEALKITGGSLPPPPSASQPGTLN